MLPSRTYGISIPRPWRELYEEVWQPAYFARWASGLAESGLREVDGEWLAEGPEGPIRIRFTAHNAFGVMDHWVDTGSGDPVHIPLRIVENADGAEVMLTLFRQPDMTDERFAADARWINRDLKALRGLVVGRPDQRSLP